MTDSEVLFSKLITELRNAAIDKDPYPILRAISADFKIERDFGGLYLERETSLINFLLIFPLDGFGVRQEYKSEGWHALIKILSSKEVIKRSKSNLCIPKGQYTNNIVQDELLCFTKDTAGAWRLSSYVNSGD